jgi:hypothetical protein
MASSYRLVIQKSLSLVDAVANSKKSRGGLRQLVPWIYDTFTAARCRLDRQGVDLPYRIAGRLQGSNDAQQSALSEAIVQPAVAPGARRVTRRTRIAAHACRIRPRCEGVKAAQRDDRPLCVGEAPQERRISRK